MSFQTAQPLLEFIRRTETGRSGREAYDVMYGHKKISPPLTQMTLDQAIAAGPGWTKAHKSSAAGAYQFMNATLKDLRKSGGLGGKKLDPDLQDALGYALLQRRGFEKFLRAEMSVQQFGLALAQEWASFPVLAGTKGQHRQVARGETYYAGDKLNKALVQPDAVERMLIAIRQGSPAEDVAQAAKPLPPTIDGVPHETPAAFKWIIAVAAVIAAGFVLLTKINGG